MAASSKSRTSCCATRTSIADIPGVIVHGRYDVVCPVAERVGPAQGLAEGASSMITPASGHSAFEAENVDALVRATDRFA